jgi:hypothetical protein
VISGACCGIMVSLQPDRGAIASLLIARFISRRFSTPARLHTRRYLAALRHLALCVAVAALIALAPLLALFKSNIVGVKLAGTADREETYKLVTQFSLGPAETLTYLVPGFFGWHINNRRPLLGLDRRMARLAEKTSGHAQSQSGHQHDGDGRHGAGPDRHRVLLVPGGPARAGPADGSAALLRTAPAGSRFHHLGSRLGLAHPFLSALVCLPLMDKWRNPLKWLEMTNFALVVLSAIGAQHLLASLDAGAPNLKNHPESPGWFTIGVLILLGLGVAASYPSPWFSRRCSRPRVAIPRHRQHDEHDAHLDALGVRDHGAFLPRSARPLAIGKIARFDAW